jgi:hypothetical protein
VKHNGWRVQTSLSHLKQFSALPAHLRQIIYHSIKETNSLQIAIRIAHYQYFPILYIRRKQRRKFHKREPEKVFVDKIG